MIGEIFEAEDSRLDFKPTTNPVPASERNRLLVDPGFGRVFTDHMAMIEYNEQDGWHGARGTAREPFTMDPAAPVLHYAQEIFEGMKAYRRANGQAGLFRPRANAQRFAKSAIRMAMPPLPEEMFLESVRSVVRADRDWIPDTESGSLYLRPFMIANGSFLGTRPSTEYIYSVIASSVESLFDKASQTVTLWATRDYVRAVKGGTGEAKCGGNYAGSLIAQAEAARQGCDQVVFLDAIERRWVEELGGMNVFFVFDDGSMVTPPLSGTILPGITRDAIMTLARKEGRTVREERYSMDQWRADAASGKLREAFACGTAAVISAIGRIKSTKGDIVIGNGDGGLVTAALKTKLVGIQRGDIADTEGWVRRIG